jgi:hypothetical protein
MSNYRRRLLLANQSEENIILYGNSVQDGIPTPDVPIDIMSIENPTIKVTGKNLYKLDIENMSGGYPHFGEATLIEKLENGVIVQGKVPTSGIGTTTWYCGWFQPFKNGSTSSVYLRKGDVVTVSADITWLDMANYKAGEKFGCYLCKQNTESNNTGVFLNKIPTSADVGITFRLYAKHTIRTTDGYYIPIFTLNSCKMKIENIQISFDSDENYEPYEEELITIDETTPFGKNWVSDDVYDIDNWIQVGSGYGYSLNLPTGNYTASVEKINTSNQFFYLQISTNDWSSFSTKHILKNAENNRVTFTVGENTKCRFYTTNSAFAKSVDSIQIEKGEYYTGYEPYVPPITAMRGIGDYKDRIYTKDGKVWFEQRSNLYETDENTVLSVNNSNGNTIQAATNRTTIEDIFKGLGIETTKANNDPGLSTHFIYTFKAYTRGQIDSIIHAGTRVWFFSDNFESIDDWNTWIKENKVCVVYPLATPVVTEITGFLAEQILNIDTNKNITIYSDNGALGEVEIVE